MIHPTDQQLTTDSHPTAADTRTKKIILFGSCTEDWGTKSITEAYAHLLSPSITIRLDRGLKRMRPMEILKHWRFLYTQRSTEVTVVCLHRAPTLIAGFFPLPRAARWITILESNESCPYGLKGFKRMFYDAVYRLAFRRLDKVYSPFVPFREYYLAQGIPVESCLYPLPFPVEAANEWQSSTITRVLFIGADYQRKGGDLLLDFWARARPQNATLTFVCPVPPVTEAAGVVFLTDITIGTQAHRDLLTSHDVIILPTFQDPFGFALLEAINFGICAITTQAAGAAGIVEASGGIVAETPQDAIMELGNLCLNPDDIKQRQIKCRNFIVSYDQALRESMKQML
jgi:glycosyltransferase involved in cell wall biosynthesis